MAIQTLRVRGIPELVSKLGPQLVNGPARRFFDRWGLMVVGMARQRAPVDRGRLRASITHESEPRVGRVGSNLPYAPPQEFGTGLLSDGPGGRGGRHHPPASGLDGWARRHGVGGNNPGFVVARAIGRRGGLRPKRFIRDSIRDSTPRVPLLVELMAREIEAGAGGGGAPGLSGPSTGGGLS